MRSMGLHNMGKRIWRFTWQSLPAATRDFLRFVAYPNVVGRINRQRPLVEVFSASRSNKVGNQLRARLEKVNVNAPTNLCRIMKRFGSDKGMGKHNYTAVYQQLFADMKKKPIRLFELGIGTNNPALASSMGVAGKPGASLRGWSEFFASGKIFAADIDRAILFDEGRIKTFYCDQLDTNAITEMWAKPWPGARTLVRDLVTLPTHSLLRPGELAWLSQMLRSVGRATAIDSRPTWERA